MLGQQLGSSADQALRAEFNLGFSDYLALHGVGARKLAAQEELRQFVGVTPAGISRIVTRLATRKLLETATDRTNRRRVLLSLTAEGADLVRRASALLEKCFEKSAERVAKSDDLSAFERVLNALLAIPEQKR